MKLKFKTQAYQLLRNTGRRFFCNPSAPEMFFPDMDNPVQESTIGKYYSFCPYLMAHARDNPKAAVVFYQ